MKKVKDQKVQIIFINHHMNKYIKYFFWKKNNNILLNI